MTEALSVYDPDSEQSKEKKINLEGLDKCPTCSQKIEKRQPLNEIRRVVTVFKMVSGFDKDDKGWDKLYFGRFMRPAKELIGFLGSWEKAADAVQDIYEQFSSIGMTVTMETIVKHAGKWKLDHLERSAKNGISNSPINGSL